MRRDGIKQILEEHGPEGYLQIQRCMLEGLKLPNGQTVKKRPEDFSLRALWEGLVGPVEDTLGFAQQQAGFVERVEHIEEAVAANAFPSAVGQLIATKIIEGYGVTAGFIGDQLMTVMPSKLRGERIVGFTTLQGPKPLGELEPYEGSTFREKFVGSVETKRGRLLEVSEEAVFFDQTGQVLLRAQGLGSMARQDRERRIVRGVADVLSTERVYRPEGTAEQLYASANNNLLSTATPLVDWTDIQEVLAFHATNVTDDREPDDNLAAQPFVWMPTGILVAMELAGVAARIVAATVVNAPGGSTSEVMAQTGNPLNQLTPGIMALASPFLDAAEGDDQFDDASDWFLGDFKRQFVYKEIWPLQTFRAPAQNEEQFGRDVVARFKVREYGDINAIDERLVVKVNAV